ncbi:hypothetical protein ABZ588_27910 [Streptomyces althioticus]|uniref:hypothetical protein n=1 Tax=Streptomyces althioticus TaxID=83380 RepID=UPI0033F6A1B3
MPDADRHRHAMLFPSDHASRMRGKGGADPRPLPPLLRLPGDPAGFRFDAVIFDEASQVLLQDAVNVIYRVTP